MVVRFKGNLGASHKVPRDAGCNIFPCVVHFSAGQNTTIYAFALNSLIENNSNDVGIFPNHHIA